MKHSRITTGLAVAGALLMALTSCAAEASEGSEGSDPIKLSYASFVDDRNPHSLAFQSWAEKVTEQTDGQITFEPHYNSALCTAGEIVSCVANGTADMGFGPAGYEPAVLPVSTFTSIGFITHDLQAQADAAAALFAENQDLIDEWEAVGARPLFHTPSNPYVIASNKEIESLEALSDLSLRASGDAAIALAKLNVNPVAMSIAESYESIERGVISGISTSIDGLATSRIYEVAPYIYDIGDHWGNGMIMHTSINASIWKSLSMENQEIMTKAAEEVAGSFVATYSVPGAEADCQVILDAGATVSEIGPASLGDSWSSEAKIAQIDDWKEHGGSSAKNPDALISEFEDLVAKNTHDGVAFSPAKTCLQLQNQ